MRTAFAPAAVFCIGCVTALAAGGACGPVSAQPPAAHPPMSRDSLRLALEAAQSAVDGITLPPATSFTFGDATVAPGDRTAGTIAVADGTLHVRGKVTGDAVAFRGDVIVHQGGDVSGNAIAILGRVTLDGGHVAGETRMIGGDLGTADAATAVPTSRSTTLAALALAGGWLAVLAIIGIAVLVFASSNLDAVSDALERDFGRAFLTGIAGQLALLPVLALLLLALTLTILGVLLIPFAIVAYVLAAAGLITLGYLAVARIAGSTVRGVTLSGERDRRASALKAVLIGLVIIVGPWFVAALLTWSPTASLVAHTVAFAVTWVACTAGLGGALVSRGGVRRLAAPAARKAMATASWQTPTPVAGVAAARRPTPAASTVIK